MAINSVEAMLRREEGEVLHEYKDHLGYSTIGVGILIDKRKGGGLRPEESAYILSNRLRILTQSLSLAIKGFDLLNDARKAVLIGMAFQMGIEGLLKFTATLKYIERGQFALAAEQMLKSLWARQTPARAKRMAEQLRTGEWQQ